MTLKRRFLVLVTVFGLFLYVICLVDLRRSNTSLKISSSSSHHANITNNQCIPHKSIGFLKTHKCASSSLQNVFLRYAYTNHLNLVLPPKYNYLGRGQPFNATLVQNLPWHHLGYHMFVLHTTWSKESVSRVLPRDAKYITILREPVDQFVSMFHYFGLASWYNVESVDHLGSMIRHGRMNPIREKFRYLGLFGRNQMLFDSGLDPIYFNNKTAILNHISKLEKEFDLVLIVEDLDNSVILMKELLCWDYPEVLTFQTNVRKKENKVPLAQLTRDRIREWLWGDDLLYQHFRKVLQTRKKEYGLKKLRDEKEYLWKVHRALYTVCSGLGFRTRMFHGLPCLMFFYPELDFLDLLRFRQLRRAQINLSE